MKILSSLALWLFLLGMNIVCSQTDIATDLEELKGIWKLDMSPEDKTDANFAEMTISSIDKNSIQGYFYRDGVKIQEGIISTQLGIVHGALVSGDDSGNYNTSFYYKNGFLYGTTHAIGRNFLAVWVATKQNQ